MTRRSWLVLGLTGLIVSAASRVTAASPVQIEPEAYGGSTVGGWTCGPTARANYGGVGGHVRVYVEEQKPKPPPEPEEAPSAEPRPDGEGDASEGERAGPPPRAPEPARLTEVDETPDLEPHGPSFGGGGGAEHREFTRVACANDTCGSGDALPPAGVLGAGRATFGWDWDYFGLRAGALVFQRWADNEDRSPTTAVTPDAELRFGRRAGLHGGLGFGGYNVATLFRPGAFLSIGYASGAWAADLRGGLHMVFDGQVGARADASVRYGISRVVAPGLGLALTGAEQLTPEGRLFVVFTP